MAPNNNIDLNVLPQEFSIDLNEIPHSEHEEGTIYIEDQIFNQFDEGSQDLEAYEEIGEELEADEEIGEELEADEEIGEELEQPSIDLNIDQNSEEDEHDPITNHTGNPQRILTVLSNEERQQVYTALLARIVNGNLKRHTTTKVSSLMSIPIRTIQRIWKQAKDTPDGSPVDVRHQKTKRVGRKRVEVDLSPIPTIPLGHRETLRLLSKALDVKYTTLHRRFKEGKIRRHSNAIKPHLKDENKRARLQFCMSMLDQSSLPHDPKFVDMYNTVHIDEKWFYLTKKSNSYYLLPQEDDPLRQCQSKNYIPKVMFLTAIARPRFDEEGNEAFSGKIGVFPLVTKQPALRRSRNREAGTLETKPITSVTKEIIRTVLVEKVIPAIQSKWPSEDSGRTIFIQQDNARTHVNPDDEIFQMAATQNGFDIRFLCQPANSPDLNVLDLGFFSAIQTLQDKECAKTVDELIHAVEKAYHEYPTKIINHVFLTLGYCMEEIMKVEGSNRYKIPHKHKHRLQRNGTLPRQVPCDYALVENANNILATINE